MDAERQGRERREAEQAREPQDQPGETPCDRAVRRDDVERSARAIVDRERPEQGGEAKHAGPEHIFGRKAHRGEIGHQVLRLDQHAEKQQSDESVQDADAARPNDADDGRRP